MKIRRILGMGLLCIPLIYSINPVKAQDEDEPLRRRIGIGVRMGWSGAPNGVSIYRQLGDNVGFEIYSGYNDKEGRRTGKNYLNKGSIMTGISLTPYLFPFSDGVPAVIYMSGGVGMRIHPNRLPEKNPEGLTLRRKGGAPMLTPEVKAGIGLLVRPFAFIEMFMDIHVLRYNSFLNYNLWGMESGVGVRLRL